MKWTTFLIIFLASNGYSQSEIGKSINEINKKKAELITEEILKAKGLKGKESKGINREIDIKKPLKECVKPNNTIDDEVKKCMEGTLDKYW